MYILRKIGKGIVCLVMMSLWLIFPAVAASAKSDFWSRAQEAGSALWSTAKEKAPEAWDKTKETAGDVYDKAKEKAPEVWDQTKEAAESLYDKAKEKAPGVYEGAKEGWNAASGKISDFRADQEEQFWGWVDQQMNPSSNAAITEADSEVSAPASDMAEDDASENAMAIADERITSESTASEPATNEVTTIVAGTEPRASEPVTVMTKSAAEKLETEMQQAWSEPSDKEKTDLQDKVAGYIRQVAASNAIESTRETESEPVKYEPVESTTEAATSETRLSSQYIEDVTARLSMYQDEEPEEPEETLPLWFYVAVMLGLFGCMICLVIGAFGLLRKH